MYFFSICNPLIKSPGLSGFREKEEKEKDTMKAANDKPISCKCVCVCVCCAIDTNIVADWPSKRELNKPDNGKGF